MRPSPDVVTVVSEQDRWHTSVCDAAGAARYAPMGRTPRDAVWFAESLTGSKE